MWGPRSSSAECRTVPVGSQPAINRRRRIPVEPGHARRRGSLAAPCQPHAGLKRLASTSPVPLILAPRTNLPGVQPSPTIPTDEPLGGVVPARVAARPEHLERHADGPAAARFASTTDFEMRVPASLQFGDRDKGEHRGRVGRFRPRSKREHRPCDSTLHAPFARVMFPLGSCSGLPASTAESH